MGLDNTNTKLPDWDECTFYEVFQQFVRSYPKTDSKCTRPQSFIVLNDYDDISKDNMGKTFLEKDSPYFYSKAWERSGFSKSKLSVDLPAMVVLDKGIEHKFSGTKRDGICLDLEIAFIESLDEDCIEKKCKGCKGRSIPEVQKDQGKFLTNFVKYVKKLVVTETEVIIHPDLLNGEDKIDKGLTRYLQRRTKNISTKFYNFYTGTGFVYGKWMHLGFCFETCKDDDLVFGNPPKSDKVLDDNCC